MRIGLACMRWCDYGGWPTFTRHLYAGLQALGHEPVILTDGAVMAAWRSLLTIAPLADATACDRVLVTVFAPDPASARALKGRIAGMVLHDPTEWRRKASRALIAGLEPPQLIFIRPAALRTFKAAQVYRRAPLTFVPHPYARMSAGDGKGARVVCTARIDHDKRTHLVVAAEREVELWTGYINWVYDNERFGGTLKKQPYYRGAFGVTADALTQVYAGACALVDMSCISGDGGGTQYTFLEAMDFGLDCILASDWHAGPTSEMQPGVHYHPVANVADLRATIDAVRASGPRLGTATAALLRVHDAATIAARYLEVMG